MGFLLFGESAVAYYTHKLSICYKSYIHKMRFYPILTLKDIFSL
ncbi:hypothetical protein H377_3410 [Rickettsia prowazekii str. Cairo 3]|nr:hypothetical protein H377_3410 [Rickettsia prowazekii str. Cairo 3]